MNFKSHWFVFMHEPQPKKKLRRKTNSNALTPFQMNAKARQFSNCNCCINCSLQHNRKPNKFAEKNEEAQKFSARKNSIAINDRHAKLPLVEQTAASTTIKQAIKRKKNGEKRRTASNWNERLFHLWRTKDYAIEGDKPHLIGSDLNKSKLIAASPFHISFCCWCSSNVEIPSVARKNRHCSTHSLA